MRFFNSIRVLLLAILTAFSPLWWWRKIRGTGRPRYRPTSRPTDDPDSPIGYIDPARFTELERHVTSLLTTTERLAGEGSVKDDEIEHLQDTVRTGTREINRLQRDNDAIREDMRTGRKFLSVINFDARMGLIAIVSIPIVYIFVILGYTIVKGATDDPVILDNVDILLGALGTFAAMTMFVLTKLFDLPSNGRNGRNGNRNGNGVNDDQDT